MNRSSLYIRNIVFGVEDSLVSTVGLLSGIALGDIPRSTILFTGLVYIFVEAFSMAVGSFLSEESVEEYENTGMTSEASPRDRGSLMSATARVGENFQQKIVRAPETLGSRSLGNIPLVGGLIMFVSFIAAGFIPLVPYLFASGYSSLIISIVVSLIALAILGYASALVIKTKPFRRALRMTILGGSAIVIGALVSLFVKVA